VKGMLGDIDVIIMVVVVLTGKGMVVVMVW
jgi:hypothetical protein